MFCGCTHPSRTLLLLAESPNHTALGIHLFTADTPCQRDGSDTTWLGHQDLVKTRLGTSQQRENGKMDLVQPVFFENSAEKNGSSLDEPMDEQWMGDVFLGILKLPSGSCIGGKERRCGCSML